MSDYISREAAIVDFERCNHENPVWTPQRVKTLLMRVPAADVEPVRHGEWRLVRRMAACGEYECSVCGRIETFGCFNKPENNPYCHCGAKMDLEDENHDN